jgi:formylglycine-generating enzyme required for sulfatase activity
LGIDELSLGASTGEAGASSDTAENTGSGGYHGTSAASDGGLSHGPAIEAYQSCRLLLATCGAAGDSSCCSAPLVQGGKFDRLNDTTKPASVTRFLLDKFEVSVERFRSFVDAGYGVRTSAPAHGTGAHPAIEGSGWQSSFDDMLPSDSNALRAALACNPNYPVWTDEPGPNERLPMPCIDWYLAFAFCIWDGARLPTEAEWNYAAAGGSEQRAYPWGSENPSLSLASFDCAWDDDNSCSISDIPPVGSTPDGNALWDQSDMAGSLTEWTLDSFGDFPIPCADCANLESPTSRVLRGGSFANGAASLRTNVRSHASPDVNPNNVGVRCARSL